MKLARFVIVLSMLFFTSLLQSQEVNPSALNFESVPPNTTPQEGIAFTNTGTTDLTLSVSIDAPFAMSENRCEKGVKPGTHCNVYITYTAQTVGEQDGGNLTINYGSGSVPVSLSGVGVSSIQTGFVNSWSERRKGEVLGATLVLNDPYYYPLGVGEQVYFSCTNGQGGTANGGAPLHLCTGGGCHAGKRFKGFGEKSVTNVGVVQKGQWSCTVTYPGDGILGPSSTEINFCWGCGP